MTTRRSDTRDRIRAMALELFSAQGYEKTSLRQIADHLGVTKAALYYHFRTKEAIVASLSDDLRRGIDELVEWAATAPPGPIRSREILDRYGALLHSTGGDMMRFMHENQPAFRELGFGVALRQQFRVIADLMTEPERAPLDVFHARQALLAISWSAAMMDDLPFSDDECSRAALEMAHEMLRCDRTSAPR